MVANALSQPKKTCYVATTLNVGYTVTCRQQDGTAECPKPGHSIQDVVGFNSEEHYLA